MGRPSLTFHHRKSAHGWASQTPRSLAATLGGPKRSIGRRDLAGWSAGWAKVCLVFKGSTDRVFFFFFFFFGLWVFKKIYVFWCALAFLSESSCSRSSNLDKWLNMRSFLVVWQHSSVYLKGFREELDGGCEVLSSFYTHIHLYTVHISGVYQSINNELVRSTLSWVNLETFYHSQPSELLKSIWKHKPACNCLRT